MSTRWRGDFPPATTPRAVEGGLVARSTRGDIGEHWWSRRFVEVLESFALGSRLTRGKNYARRGQVVSLAVSAGAVAAVVQGSRRTPYRVRIGLTPFSELVWAKVEVTLAEQAIYSARLLAGELPAELEQVFAAAGAPLFPGRAADLGMSCSCPDGEVPCKHLAATFYLLAESLDDDPFQLLHWRGRDRQVLLRRLRELRGDAPSQPSQPSQAPAGHVAELQLAMGAVTALADLASDDRPATSAHAADPEAFWAAPGLPPLPAHPDLPPDLLLRQLPVPGVVLGGAGLVTALRPLYVALAVSRSQQG